MASLIAALWPFFFKVTDDAKQERRKSEITAYITCSLWNILTREGMCMHLIRTYFELLHLVDIHVLVYKHILGRLEGKLLDS